MKSGAKSSCRSREARPRMHLSGRGNSFNGSRRSNHPMDSRLHGNDKLVKFRLQPPPPNVLVGGFASSRLLALLFFAFLAPPDRVRGKLGGLILVFWFLAALAVGRRVCSAKCSAPVRCVGGAQAHPTLATKQQGRNAGALCLPSIFFG